MSASYSSFMMYISVMDFFLLKAFDDWYLCSVKLYSCVTLAVLIEQYFPNWQ